MKRTLISIGLLSFLSLLAVACWLGGRSGSDARTASSGPEAKSSKMERAASAEESWQERLTRAGRNPDPVRARLERRALLRSWCLADPGAAFQAWMAASGEVEVDPGFTQEFVSGLHRELGYERTLDLVAEMPESVLRTGAMVAVADRVGQAPVPSRAADLLLARATPQERPGMLAQAMHSWSGSAGLEEISVWLDAHRSVVGSGAAMAELERAASLKMLDSQPREAIAWLEKRSAPEVLPDQLRYATLRWASAAPNAAAEWLATLPAGPVADGAVAQFAETVTADDPESAVSWAESIADPELRRVTLERVRQKSGLAAPGASR